MKLAHRFYLALVVPGIIISALVTILTYLGLQTNAANLTAALRIQAKGNRVLSLLLTQDDASKAMLMDPNHFEAFSGTKIKAFDEHKKLLQELQAESTSPDVLKLIAQLEEIDGKVLRPTDTQILETMFTDIDAARKMYFDIYEPSRQKYAAIIRELAEVTSDSAFQANEGMAQKNSRSLVKIVLAMLFGILGTVVAIYILSNQVERADRKTKSALMAVKNILDNVTFGLFICDNNLKLREGYSRSCEKFFGYSGEGSLVGKSLPELLKLSKRESDNLLALYSQIFEDMLPEDFSLDQLPNRFQINSKTISMTGSVVRNATRNVESVLFCVADISALVKAEQEVEEAHSLLRILRNRERFQQFMQEVAASIDTVRKTLDTKGIDESAKRILHTLKGNFGVYGLSMVSSIIHGLESQTSLKSSDMLALEQAIRNFLDRHESLLSVHYGVQREAVYTVKDSLLKRFQTGLQDLNDIHSLKKSVADFFSAVYMKSAKDLIGPIEELCAQLAARFDKKIRFELVGGEILLPPALFNLVQNLTHLLRNAIDHGLEKSSERGTKDSVGTLRLIFSETLSEWQIVVNDDGRGINTEALIEKGLSHNLFTPADAVKMSHEEKLKLIFSGISTAASISEISGRGIGMRAVENAVQAINGAIKVETVEGRGTTIALTVPKEVTLAAI